MVTSHPISVVKRLEFEKNPKHRVKFEEQTETENECEIRKY